MRHLRFFRRLGTDSGVTAERSKDPPWWAHLRISGYLDIFIPREVLRVTHVLDKKTGDALDTKITRLRRSAVKEDGSLEWSQRIPPNNKINVYDTSYESSRWLVRKDGSIVTPTDEIFPDHPNYLKQDANDMRALQPSPAAPESPMGQQPSAR